MHCDLKPSNVLVTAEDRVVILDFGLVMETEPHLSGPRRYLAGTPAYMSPEQAAGEQLSKASDWYSVGVMLYQALTGDLPFTGQVFEVLAKKQREEPPSPSEVVQGIPEDLNALCCALLRRDPEARLSGSEILRRLAGVPDGEVPTVHEDLFAGRERHVECLMEAFEATRKGRTVTVYLHGASGIGKTTLAHHFLEKLRNDSDVLVLTGRCYERELLPYKAVDSLVDALCQYLQGQPSSKVEALRPRDYSILTRLFPVLRQMENPLQIPLEDAGIPDLQQLRARGFAALRELLKNLSRQKSLVLFIDDLQWGDMDSALLLNELLHPPEPPSLLLVGCYRSEEVQTSPFLRMLLRLQATSGSDVRHLALEEFEPAEARNMALALLGGEYPDRAAHADEIARESGGNPFLLHELVWCSRGSDKLARALPSVDGVVQLRLAGLPTPARLLLELAAVAAQPIDLSAAALAAELGSERHEALALLRGRHLLRTRQTEESDELEVYHHRIRESVEARLAAHTLQAHHHRLALALESSGRTAPERLLWHFLGAGCHHEASYHAVAAGDQSFEALAFDSAAKFYRQALELQPAGVAASRTLRVKLADALANAGFGAEAAKQYLAAIDGSVAAEALELQRRAAWQYLISGHMEQGLETVRQVLSAEGMSLAPSPRRALLSLLLRRAWIAMRGLRFRERDASQVSDRELMRIDICWSVAQGLAMVDMIHAADFQARHLVLALRSGEPYRIARALAMEAAYQATSGSHNPLHSKRILRRATELAAKTRNPHAIALTELIAGASAFLQGNWKNARMLLESAEVILREHCAGVAWELATVRLMGCVSLFFLGELEALCSRLPELLRNAESRGDLYEATDLRIRISHAECLAMDDPETALQQVAQAIARWPADKFYTQHWWALIAKTEINLYCGHNVAALQMMTEQWAALRDSLLLRVQYILIESLFHRGCTALAAAVECDSKTAPRDRLLNTVERDAARIRRERTDWGDPLAQLLRAGIAATREEIKEAVAQLTLAETGFESAGMALYHAAARRYRGELIGGEEGRTLVQTADAWMQRQRIRRPECMAAMLAPGLRPV